MKLLEILAAAGIGYWLGRKHQKAICDKKRVEELELGGFDKDFNIKFTEGSRRKDEECLTCIL